MLKSKLRNFARLISVAFLVSVVATSNVQAAITLNNNATGKIDGYDYEYWKDTGNGTMTLNGGGTFSCSWNNINNILFRTGKKLGSTQTYQQYGNIYIDYACDYRPNGNSYLSVYGWTQGPLVEYYIIESYGTWKPPGSNNVKGYVNADGGTYEIYETTRYNQPSIEGNTTFQQYWSVRTQKRTSGVISVHEHFKAWESKGMRMGRLYEVSMVVEGYQSSGQANMTKMEITMGGSYPGGGNNGGGNNGGGWDNGGGWPGGGWDNGGGNTGGNTGSGTKTVTNNDTGTHGGYNYEYWKDNGNGTMILKDGGSFSCEWSNINNILFRKGIKYNETQTHQQIGTMELTYECDYQPNGNSYLAVYGWTSDPLVEYYIIESWGNWRPPGNEPVKGTVTVDGGTYDIYETTRYNQPSIKGTATFQQYWSVRQQKRTSGKISVSEHFKAWESRGMRMGKFYEISLVVEGYQSSGKADVKSMTISINGVPHGGSTGGNPGGGNPGGGNPGGGWDNGGGWPGGGWDNGGGNNGGGNNQTSGLPLRELTKKLREKGREFYIGCAVPSYFSDADQNIVKTEFDIVTCENDMKIGTISPNQNQFNFSGGDRIVNFAKQNGMIVHGHALVWHKYNPWWVDGTKTMMESYINTVATHFKGNVYAWDVVNEAIHRDGSFRINAIGTNGQDGASIFGQKQGKQYIEDAFIAARKADPYAKLIYNDYDLMTRDAKFEGVYNMVKDFKERGIPIDGVGFQGHLGPDFTEAQARAFGEKMQRLAALGVESYVTEMDVGCSDTSQSGLNKQAEVFRWITEECVKQPYCRALQVWGIRDSQSWRINPDAPEDRAIAPLIFDDNGQKKPAYYAIQKVLEEAVNSLENPQNPQNPQIVEGDVNGDGEFNSIDFATARQILLGKLNNPSYQYWREAFDLNKDGTNDALDFAIMRKRLLGQK